MNLLMPNLNEAMLAISFPPDRGYHGAATTILDLSRHGLPRPGFIGTKFEAVNLIVAVNLGRNRARGHGSKARRRLNAILDRKPVIVPAVRGPLPSPAQRAADAASELHSEGRIHRNTRPQRHE